MSRLITHNSLPELSGSLCEVLQPRPAAYTAGSDVCIPRRPECMRLAPSGEADTEPSPGVSIDARNGIGNHQKQGRRLWLLTNVDVGSSARSTWPMVRNGLRKKARARST